MTISDELNGIQKETFVVSLKYYHGFRLEKIEAKQNKKSLFIGSQKV